MPLGMLDEYQTAATAGGSTLRDPGRGASGEQTVPIARFAASRRATAPRDTGRERARGAAMPRIELGHDCGACIPAIAHSDRIEKKFSRQPSLVEWIRPFDERSPISSHRLNPCAHNLARAVREAPTDDHVRCRRFHPRCRRTPGESDAALGALGVVFGDIGTSPIYAFRESLRAAGSAAARGDGARHPLAGVLGRRAGRGPEIRRLRHARR